MAKRGQRLPFKVEYKYPAHPRPYRVAKADKDSALLLGRDIARRGAAVRVYHRDPDTRVETNIASYDVTAWEVQAQRALDTLNAKGAPASATLAELHDIDTAAYRMLIEALAAMAPVTGEEVEPEHLALAGLRPTAGGLFETSDHDRISHSWIVSSRDIDRCPRHSFLPSHYHRDGTCRCQNREDTQQ